MSFLQIISVKLTIFSKTEKSINQTVSKDLLCENQTIFGIIKIL